MAFADLIWVMIAEFFDLYLIYAFEAKCIWALRDIANSEAKKVLDHIAVDTNAVLAQNAKKQLNWLLVIRRRIS